MPLRRRAALATLPPWLCRSLAAALVVGAATLHWAFLAHDCPLDLIADEAHYWDWSRHLDWSYYSKGPLVAYLIRASCELLGPWAEAHTGSLMPAVRAPAVVCGSLLLVSLYVLTVQVFRREPLALAVVAAALTLPILAVGSSLMTIDAPYTCCWGWALVLCHRAVFRGSGWAWPAAGLVVALGILAKYTMVLFVPSLALFMLTSPEHRPLLRRREFWRFCAAAALGGLPILVWNAQHDWVTFRHVLGLSGVAGEEGPHIYWLGPLVYVGTQCGLFLVIWFVAWVAAMGAHRPWAESDAGVRYLWWLSAPMFAWFGAFSLKTGGGELNWPVTAYLSGLVLVAAWLARQLESPSAIYRGWLKVNLGLVCGLGLALTLFVHNTTRLQPVLAWLSGPPTPENPFPLRKFDPTCRLRGWRTLAAEVDRLRDELASRGEDPVLAGSSWTVPGELGLYCKGHPQAYCFGLVYGERHSQYDLWQNPIDDPAAFAGRTFIVVGGVNDDLARGFESIGPTREVFHYENGQPISFWLVTVCRGYKGLPPEVLQRAGEKF
jgi:hypothetical protein